MDNTSPAQAFLLSLGSMIDDPNKRQAIYKHNTLEGRPGDPHAPGDPFGYASANRKGSPHQEIGGNEGELVSQEPHGRRGLDTAGSIQTLMILLRKVADVFGDSSISSWNEYLTWQDESIWDEAARVFGSRERARELIDALPKRETGKNINIDDVPEKLLRRYYQGNKKGKKKKEKPVSPKKRSAVEPKKMTPAEEEEVARAVNDIIRLRNVEISPENAEKVTEMWLDVLRSIGLGQLTTEQLKNFFALSFEEKLDVLESLLEGLNTREAGL